MEAKTALAIALALTGGMASPAMAQTGDWTGPYLGVSAGAGAGSQSQAGGVLLLPSQAQAAQTSCPIYQSGYCYQAFDGRYSMGGGLVGGGGGYNWQRERFVFGAEADGSWSGIHGSGTCGIIDGIPVGPHACGGGINSLYTFRGRLGYDLGSFGATVPVLLYATGGLAVAQVRGWDSMFGTSGSGTVAGWTAGAGLEFQFSPAWSLKAEYLHVDLGSHGVFTASPPNMERLRTTAEIGRVGLNYHFVSSAPVPVVAKY